MTGAARAGADGLGRRADLRREILAAAAGCEASMAALVTRLAWAEDVARQAAALAFDEGVEAGLAMRHRPVPPPRRRHLRVVS